MSENERKRLEAILDHLVELKFSTSQRIYDYLIAVQGMLPNCSGCQTKKLLGAINQSTNRISELHDEQGWNDQVHTERRYLVYTLRKMF